MRFILFFIIRQDEVLFSYRVRHLHRLSPSSSSNVGVPPHGFHRVSRRLRIETFPRLGIFFPFSPHNLRFLSLLQ